MRAWITGRVERSRRMGHIAIGDVAMIVLFVTIGEIRHGGSVAAGVETVSQFGLGWLVAAIAAGAYAGDAIDRPGKAVMLGVGTWVVAVFVGQLIRLQLTPGTTVQPSFVLVSIGIGGLFIGTWRAVATRFTAD